MRKENFLASRSTSSATASAAVRRGWALLVGLLIAFVVGASIYVIIDSMISGSITTTNRGPRTTYLRDLQPRRYWFEVAWQSLPPLLLVSVALFGLRIHRKVRK